MSRSESDTLDEVTLEEDESETRQDTDWTLVNREPEDAGEEDPSSARTGPPELVNTTEKQTKSTIAKGAAKKTLTPRVTRSRALKTLEREEEEEGVRQRKGGKKSSAAAPPPSEPEEPAREKSTRKKRTSAAAPMEGAAANESAPPPSAAVAAPPPIPLQLGGTPETVRKMVQWVLYLLAFLGFLLLLYTRRFPSENEAGRAEGFIGGSGAIQSDCNFTAIAEKLYEARSSAGNLLSARDIESFMRREFRDGMRAGQKAPTFLMRFPSYEEEEGFFQKTFNAFAQSCEKKCFAVIQGSNPDWRENGGFVQQSLSMQTRLCKKGGLVLVTSLEKFSKSSLSVIHSVISEQGQLEDGGESLSTSRNIYLLSTVSNGAAEALDQTHLRSKPPSLQKMEKEMQRAKKLLREELLGGSEATAAVNELRTAFARRIDAVV